MTVCHAQWAGARRSKSAKLVPDRKRFIFYIVRCYLYVLLYSTCILTEIELRYKFVSSRSLNYIYVRAKNKEHPFSCLSL